MDKKLFLFALWSSAVGVFTSVTVCALHHIALVALFLKSFKHIPFREILKKYLSIKVFLFFISTVILSLLISRNSLPNYRHLKYFLIGSFGFIFSDYISHKIKSKEITFILNFSLAAIIFASIYGFTKSFIGFDLFKMKMLENFEAVNYARNPGLTGVMRFSHGISWVLTLLLGFMLCTYKSSKKISYKYVITFCVILIGLVTTGSRGALLGFLISLPLMMFYLHKKIFIACSLVTILAILGYIQYTVKHKENGPIRLMNLNSRSTSIRLNQLKGAIEVIKNNFWGVGPKNVNQQIDLEKEKNNFLDKFNFDNEKHFSTHSHNLFLELMASYGVIPGLIFILWLLTWAFDVYSYEKYRIILIPFFLNYVTSSQFEYTFDANNSFLIFTLYAFTPLVLKSYDQKTLSGS